MTDARPDLDPSASSVRSVAVVAAVIWKDDQLLLTQRPPGGPLGLQWEFPGGKLERGETAEQALVREVREELGVVATPLATLGRESHVYAHGLAVELTFVACSLESYAFTPSHAVHAWRWVALDAVELSEVLEADRPFVERLRAAR